MDIREETIDDLLQARSEIDEELRRHKTKITVLFTDVVGSTNYFDRFGDTAGLLLLHRHDNYVSSAVFEFEGTVIKTIGDSVMAEFPQPLLAVYAAIGIQRRLLQHNRDLPEAERLQVRTGINCGVGFRRSEDLFGDAVNLAARITKRGGPGQILISRSVQEYLVHTDIAFRPLGRATLDGKVEAEELYEVLWDDASDRSTHAEPRITPAPAAAALSSPSNDSGSTAAAEPVISRYQILERVGVGGMGVVFKAYDRETGEVVALKVLRPEIADQSPLVEGLKNELRLARRITHKNVCRIYDFNRSEGTAFITMEFVQGESLRHVLNRFGALNLRKAVNVARQICEGLYEAHSQGIVHRDLKPENLMIDEFGNVKLMDFGLAHLVAEGGSPAVGTPSYMAPEQLQDRPIDQRADIFALGLVLFEVFTGTAAFTDDTPVAVALKHIQDSPRNPREIEPLIPEGIAQAILRCLEKDPANRFQSVEELEAAFLDEAVQQKDRRPMWKNVSSDLRGLVTAVSARPRAPLAMAGYAALGIVLATAGIAFHRRGALQPMPAVEETLATLASPAENLNQTEPLNRVPARPTRALIPAVESHPRLVVNRTHRTPQALSFSRFFNTAAITGGVFMMGNDNGRSDERPQHRVKLKEFRMGRGEVTNRQYLAFLEDSGYQRPQDPAFAKNYLVKYPDLPVVNVSYGDALEFCKWATKKFGLPVRLPTEAEWEYAAGGGSKKNAGYPWGMERPLTHARYSRNALRGLPTVGRAAFAPNGYGLYNMSGNVSEWVADFYRKDYYKISAIKDPRGPGIGLKRVVRGGSWADDEPELTITRRSSRDPAERRDDIGFRIVVGGTMSPSPEEISTRIADARTKTQTVGHQW
jgi:formylglycine-generating enzyme required for sulfatase activity/class 3 adenylate cyclase/predicted Ser/Thr protein kinase